MNQSIRRLNMTSAAGATLCALASASGVTLFSDIQYDSIPGIEPNLLSLDIYVPDNADGANPVMMMFHGGSWIMGDKNGDERLIHPKMDYYTERGWIFLSVNYRLTIIDPLLPIDHPDQVTHPDHINDVVRSIAWTIEYIAAYGGDPDHLVLMGHSAGAHLVALAATDENRLIAEGLSLNAIDGVVALDGLYNVPLRNTQTPSPPGYNQLIWGFDPQTQQDFSPALHVTTTTGCIPPMLVVYQDAPQTIEQSIDFISALQVKNFDVAGFKAIGKTHADIGGNVGIIGDPLTIQVDAFLAEIALPSADINVDGSVNTADLGILLAAFGTTNPNSDLNNDGVIDTADLGRLLGAFGMICP